MGTKLYLPLEELLIIMLSDNFVRMNQIVRSKKKQVSKVQLAWRYLKYLDIGLILKHLSPMRRKIISLAYKRSLSDKEIAEQIGWREESVLTYRTTTLRLITEQYRMRPAKHTIRFLERYQEEVDKIWTWLERRN